MTTKEAIRQVRVELTISHGFNHLYYTWYHAHDGSCKKLIEYADEYARQAVEQWPDYELPPVKDLKASACHKACEANMKLFNDYKVSPQF